MGVRIPGSDRPNADRRRQVAQGAVAALVSSLVGALELDEEPLGPERARERGGAVWTAYRKAMARAAGKTDEPLVQLGQQPRVESRRQRFSSFFRSRSRMCRGEQPAEIRVARRALDEQRHVRTVGQCHLRAGDRAHAERLCGVRELERAVDTLVVGQRQRLVAELGRLRSELLGQRGTVEERIG